ncbi:MAG: GNAT family N-acetyltransferase [Bryobacteraceae bacterium]
MTRPASSPGDASPLAVIREAVCDDVPQLCTLLAGLFALEADFTPDAERQRRGLRLILDNPEVGRIYCATQSEGVIGMITILFTVSTAEGGRAAWLEDMVVHPDWRRRGIGRHLLNHALAEAKMASCTRITLLTDCENHQAMRFYSRAGFVRSAMTPFRLNL